MTASNKVRSNLISFPVLAAFVTILVSAPAVIPAQQPAYPAQQPAYNDPNYPPQNYQQDDQQADPPSRVGRLSIMQGNVSLQSAGVEDFGAAEMNYPLTNGDRLYTDNGARAELEAGQLAVRMAQQTDFTVTSLDDQVAQFGLAQGSVHLRAYALDPNATTELDTPNAAVICLQAGDVRIDVSPQGDVTTVTVFSGQVQVNADGVQQTLQPGQSFRVQGLNPSYGRLIGRPRTDDLDRFSADRDNTYQRAFATDNSYVNPDTVGSADLANYGDWDNNADYGAVWYPRGVAVDWAPYSVGRWASVGPWGWTWIGAEPWGFAPFHYGRWNRFGNRWGWIPGPPIVRPVYSPALVAFVGGPGFSLSIVSGGGVAAWFPLGPREVYRPWYRSSPVYINRVNVTNIYSRNQNDVRRIYNQRTNVYGNVNPGNYVNRSVATTAIPQRSFGSGRPVRESMIRGDQRQFQNAPVQNRPPIAPPQRVDNRAPARALPPSGAQRPALDTRDNGSNRGGRNGQPNQGSSQPVNPPNRGNNVQPAEIVRPNQPSQPTRTDNPRGNGGQNGNPNSGQFTYPNSGRGTDGRPANGSAPVQQNPAAPAAQQPTVTAPSVPFRKGDPNNPRVDPNEGRFNNGNVRPTPPAPAAPVQTAPAQPPARQDVPVRVNPMPNANATDQPQRYQRPQPAQQPQAVPQPEQQRYQRPQPAAPTQPQQQVPQPQREQLRQQAPPPAAAPPPQRQEQPRPQQQPQQQAPQQPRREMPAVPRPQPPPPRPVPEAQKQ